MDATIQIKLFATLSRFAPKAAASYPIESGQTIRQLIHQLALPEKQAKLIFVNGIKKDLDSKLSNGDRIGIFPPVGGG